MDGSDTLQHNSYTVFNLHILNVRIAKFRIDIRLKI